MVSIYPVFNQTVNQHLNSLIVPHPLQLYDSLLINIQYFLRTQLKILDLFKHNMPFAIFDTFDQLLILHVQSYFGFLLQLFKTVSKVVFLQKLQNQLDELVLFHLHLHSINYLRTRSLLNIGSGVVQLVSMLVCRTIDPGSNPGAGVIFMLSSIYCYFIINILSISFSLQFSLSITGRSSSSRPIFFWGLRYDCLIHTTPVLHTEGSTYFEVQ